MKSRIIIAAVFFAVGALIIFPAIPVISQHAVTTVLGVYGLVALIVPIVLIVRDLRDRDGGDER